MNKVNKKNKIKSIIFFIGIFAVFFFDIKETDINLEQIFYPISREYLLGTDNLGRDIYFLMLYGGLKTLRVVIISNIFSFVVGNFLGIISGYFQNKVSLLIKALVDLLLIVPTFILAIIITSIWGINSITAGLSLGLYGIGTYMNQSENLTKREKEKDYIQASIVLGTPCYVILYKGIFFNISSELYVNLGNTASNTVLQYAALTFIGLGADYTKPDWGLLLYQYRIYLIEKPLLVIIPCLAIFILSLFLNLLLDKEEKYE